MPKMYVIDLDTYRAVRRWCRRSPRREVGGVLGHRGRYIIEAIQVTNVSTRPSSRYELQPKEYRAARMALWRRGLSIAHWHSHPRASATPSQLDVDSQDGLELIWAGSVNRPRLWMLKGTRRRVLANELELLVGCDAKQMEAYL
jgi:proteasome lid subunit RPN8/RPN11